jgi:hypothetical protein
VPPSLKNEVGQNDLSEVFFTSKGDGMVIAVVFYWLICGWATFMLPTKGPDPRGVHALVIFGLCMVFGGLVIPARLIAKLAS